MSSLTSGKSLLCRTHLHHKWVPERTEDGERFIRCARCGEDHTDVDEGNFEGNGFGAGLAGLGGGG
jgi:hypothetical protein